MLPPILTTQRRFHDFDALRSAAMLLGIVLHGMMSLVPLPVAAWPAQDVARDNFYLYLLHGIHGFRLQLFFVFSGFFTAMMWKKYGLKKLLGHRSKRVLLPLVVYTACLTPVLWGLGFYGSRVATNYNSSVSIWDAAKAGDAEAVKRHISAGADPSAPDLTDVTPLGWASAMGHVPVVKVLLENGADVNATEENGTTALHNAALLGRKEMVNFLVEAGASVNAKTFLGDTPLSATKVDEITTIFISEMMSTPVDDVTLMANRVEVIQTLMENGAEYGTADLEEPLAWFYPFLPGLKPLVNQLPPAAQSGMEYTVILWLISLLPIFQHLWFLYYLFLLVLGFGLVAWLARKRGWKPVPNRMVAWPECLLWVLPLTCVTQFFMLTTFGPDTGASPVPWPPLLMYYAVFFGFGMLCFGRQAFESTACRLWPLSLLLAIPVFILGVYGYDQRTELFDPSQNASLSSFLEYHLLCTVFSSFYPWLMIFGLIGIFRKYCAAENRRVRYLSDAAYWLYIAHLPLVMLLQIWIANATWPSGLKLLSICILTTALLLAIYEYGVRYTWVGSMLNGRKFRDK